MRWDLFVWIMFDCKLVLYVIIHTNKIININVKRFKENVRRRAGLGSGHPCHASQFCVTATLTRRQKPTSDAVLGIFKTDSLGVTTKICWKFPTFMRLGFPFVAPSPHLLSLIRAWPPGRVEVGGWPAEGVEVVLLALRQAFFWRVWEKMMRDTK